MGLGPGRCDLGNSKISEKSFCKIIMVAHTVYRVNIAAV